ncbi:MAG: hypothetical protein ACKOXB_05600 [Flavobacteriales bacterium]
MRSYILMLLLFLFGAIKAQRDPFLDKKYKEMLFVYDRSSVQIDRHLYVDTFCVHYPLLLKGGTDVQYDSKGNYKIDPNGMIRCDFNYEELTSKGIYKLRINDPEYISRLNLSNLEELMIYDPSPKDINWKKFPNLKRVHVHEIMDEGRRGYLEYRDLYQLFELRNIRELYIDVSPEVNFIPETCLRNKQLEYLTIFNYEENIFYPISFIKDDKIQIQFSQLNAGHPDNILFGSLGILIIGHPTEFKYVPNEKDQWKAWENNKEKIYKENKAKVAQVNYRGPETGRYLLYYTNGQKLAEGEFKENLPVGKWMLWYDNGKVYEERHYENGIETGTWVKYKESGDTAYTLTFDKGKIASSKRSFQNLEYYEFNKFNVLAQGTWELKYDSIGRPVSGVVKAYYPGTNRIAVEQIYEEMDSMYMSYTYAPAVCLKSSLKLKEDIDIGQFSFDYCWCSMTSGYYLVYDENGKIQYKVHMKGDKRNGLFIKYNEKGDIVKQVEYKQGVY